MNITYEKCGDYLIPNLIPDLEPEGELRKFGLMRKSYLENHRRSIYSGLLLSGELKKHLLMIQEQADQIFPLPVPVSKADVSLIPLIAAIPNKYLSCDFPNMPGRWSPGMKKLLKDEKIDMMVDGHSHILRIMYDKELGLLHINPGAAGLQGWQQKRTIVKLVIDGKEFNDCEVIELSK